MKKTRFVLIVFVLMSVVYFIIGENIKTGQNENTVITSGDSTTTTTNDSNIPVTLSSDTSQAYKIGIANENRSYTIVSSENNYSSALYKVSNVDIDNLIIVHNDKIIYVKYGYIDFETKPVTENTTFYVNGTQSYLNGHSAVDGLFIDTENNQYKMQVSNVIGYVNSNDVNLVPMSYVKSPSYYLVNSNHELVHAISTNLYQANQYVYSGMLDQAPTYLQEGVKYYSYDGIYFYTDLVSLTEDIRQNSHNQAINYNNPYYNYYEYLPLRSTTEYTADELNQFLTYKLNAYHHTDSVLYNTGSDFIDAQNNYHVNGTIELAWAIHESAYGTSTIAKDKNNLFGLNAYDSSPYASASTFDSIEVGINAHMHDYVDSLYLNNDFINYSGANLGNKGIGINIFYASDPYWGEKIAAIYYQIDKYLGFKDYHHYQIGFIKDNTNIYTDTSDSNLVYVENSSNVENNQLFPVIVTEINDTQIAILTNNNTIGYVDKKDIDIIN